MKIIRKLSIRLILFQALAIHLFGIAFFRFYYFLNADFYECLFRSDYESRPLCWEPYKDQTLGSLISEPFYYIYYGLCFGVLLIITINLIKRKSFYNTLLIIVIYILLMYIGAFSNRYLDSWIYSFARLFSKKIGISNLIASLILFFMALLLVWGSVKNKLLSKTGTDHV